MTNASAISSAGFSEDKVQTGKRVWTGRIVAGLSGVLLILDAAGKLFKPAPVIAAMIRLGYPESTIVSVGVVLLLATIVYLIPRTSVLGAVLLTAYLGGAVATNFRAQQGLFPIVFPVIFACFVWAGVWLRDARLGQLLPLKK